MINMEKKTIRPDLLLLGAFLAIGILLFAILQLTAKEGASVSISVCGEVTETFPLNKNMTCTIEGKDGGTNVLVIEDGYAWLTEASCPDGLCVNMGKIHKDGESIICLPNQVVVTVVDETYENGEPEVDIITGGHH